jgi:hypothetical protein
MDWKPEEARIAQREAGKSAARAKAAREKRRAQPAQANVGRPAANPEFASVERRREVIASLWRVAEEQTHALEGRRGAPVSSSELKALVDVLERLERMEKVLPPPLRKRTGPPQSVGEIEIKPFSFEETNLLIEEIAQRFEEFARTEPMEHIQGPLCSNCGAAILEETVEEGVAPSYLPPAHATASSPLAPTGAATAPSPTSIESTGHPAARPLPCDSGGA